MAVWTLAFASLAALVSWAWSPAAGEALLFGAACGLFNSFAVMFGYERLAGDGKGAAVFVVSSALRLVIFGVAPAIVATRGPLWAVGCYYLGFFTPLASYAIIAGRAWRAG
jgi:hypothetical protein